MVIGLIDLMAYMFNLAMNMFDGMPPLQLALVIFLFVFSIGAGNAVVALHYRRVGKPILKSMLNPTSFPVRNFNAKEWLMLAGVFAISMVLIVLVAHAGQAS